MIKILLLTKRKRIAHRWCSTIFKKWDLQVTFPASYKAHTYITACIHTCTMCQVHSRYKLIKHATSVYVYCPQAIEMSSTSSIHASSQRIYSYSYSACTHTQIFFKCKSSCTVLLRMLKYYSIQNIAYGKSRANIRSDST